MNLDNTMKTYFASIEKEVTKTYELAEKARAKGKDPEPEVNIPIARDLSARVEGLLSTMIPELKNSGLADEIRKLEKQYGKNDERVALIAGRDIALEKIVKFPEKIKAIEAGLRVAIAYLTLGIVTAPLEGLSDVKLKKNDDGTEYLSIYFAGPIRSAGGTASAMSVLAADFIRIHCKIAPYIPKGIELQRYSTEVEDYYSRVTAKQYHPTKEEIEFIIENVPVEINGDPTEKLEVSNFKDLERVETNQIRGGMCLVLLDGLPLKAEKMLKRIMKYPDDYGLKHWLWLKKFIAMKKKIHAAPSSKGKEDIKYIPNAKYIDKIIAGRPVFSYPAEIGGFRLRYGRSRTGGLASTSIHPLTMHLIPFLAVGTQIATELPGKATVCTPCDTMEGPVVLMKNGDVIEIETKEQIKKIKPEIKTIISLGDTLIPYGEFVSNGHMLLPSSYVEEWWALEVKEALEKTSSNNNKTAIKDLSKYTSKPYPPPTLDEAFNISETLNIPLHPYYNFFWHDITKDDLKDLVEWFSKSTTTSQNIDTAGRVGVREGKEPNTKGDMNITTNDITANNIATKNQPVNNTINNTVTLTAQDTSDQKKILETLCAPHTKKNETITLTGKSLAIPKCLGSPTEKNKASLIKKIDKSKSVMDALKNLSSITIKEKGTVRVGMKMGRPEKAERRLMKGRPQVLFPCGEAGGRMRNLMESYKAGTIESSVSAYRCTECGKETYFAYCYNCGAKATPIKACRRCNAITYAPEHCGLPTAGYRRMKLDMKTLIDNAKKNIKLKEQDTPELFKGVRGVFGANKNVEPLEKGLLRAKYNLYVNKDGTTRLDSTDVPVTHFKPREISVPVETLRNFGYEKDINGNELTSEEQILTLYPQDIIISDNKEFSTADHLINICKFTDQLLVKFYHLKPFYNIKTKDQLVGQLVIGLAPHTSAGIIGRIIGFTPARIGLAHPFWHAGKRRNCLHPKEPILIKNAGKLKLINIEDLDNPKAHYKDERIPIENMTALSTDQNGEIKEKKITHLLKRKAPKYLYHIKTQYGREIKTTQEHKLLVYENKKIIKKQASELKKGDTLLSLSKITCKQEKELDILKHYMNLPKEKKSQLRIHGTKKQMTGYINKHGGFWKVADTIKFKPDLGTPSKSGKSLHTAVNKDAIPLDAFENLIKLFKKPAKTFKELTIGYAKQKSQISPKIILNRPLGELLGLLLSDGYVRTTHKKDKEKYVYQTCWCASDKTVVKRITKNCKLLFNREPSISQKEVDVLTLSGRVFYDLFINILKTGKYARHKHIPEIILNSPNECIEGCLAGYIAGDGCIDKNSIKITSVNKNMINELAVLSLRLNIFPHLSTTLLKPKKGNFAKTDTEFYYLNIYSEDSKILCKSLFGKKKEKLTKNIATVSKKRIKTYKNFVLTKIKDIEIIPADCSYVYDLEIPDPKTYIGGFGSLGIYDCDGDEDSIMLLMDALLNFSRQFMPDTRGGRTMDAPLVLTTCLDPEEVDDESWNVDVDETYPLEFYHETQNYPHTWDLKSKPRIVEELIGKPEVFHTKFTHDTYDINEGPHRSRYTQLDTMLEKLFAQLNLERKLRAVDEDKVAEAVLSKHFLRDIKGNLRKFSKQGFRCVNCNEKYRRVPLIGKCTRCGGKLLLTISEGSARKYIEPSKRIMDEFKITSYLRQQFFLLEKEADSMFGKKARQLNLSKYK